MYWQVHSCMRLMIPSQWDQMLISRSLVNVFICAHNNSQEDTLKNITNSGRNLEIILECKRLAISVGNGKEESSMFKKPTCSVISHSVNILCARLYARYWRCRNERLSSLPWRASSLIWEAGGNRKSP